ncbi:MAG: HEPN domain-containing protein [Saprospiraceae bacterium]|nr:HEPN domain-containing protein [Saprospiraceae bacterium]
MISPEQRQELIRMRLEQAHATARSAELLFDNGDARGALNRLYYSMFYAVSALALRDNFQTSKHGQLLGWFNKNFVKTGVFEPVMYRILSNAFDRRTDADYEIKPLPEDSTIPVMIEQMKFFIAQIEAYLQS